MNDFRKSKEYELTRPFFTAEEFITKSDEIYVFYKEFKEKYKKMARRKNGLVSNKNIDELFNRIIDSKERTKEECYLLDSFCDTLINMLMSVQNFEQVDGMILLLLGKIKL